MKTIERAITPRLLAALKDTPAVMLVGPRQAGKSTLVQGLAAGPHPARYVTLDDLRALDAAQRDPVGLIESTDGSLVIDEIQRAPELLLPIKAAIDHDRRPGRFILTGSAQVMLLPRVSESLAGRVEIHTLWPFSQAEIEGVSGRIVELLLEELLETGAARAGEHPQRVWSSASRAAAFRRRWGEAPIAARSGSPPTSPRSSSATCATWRT